MKFFLAIFPKNWDLAVKNSENRGNSKQTNRGNQALIPRKGQPRALNHKFLDLNFLKGKNGLYKYFI